MEKLPIRRDRGLAEQPWAVELYKVGMWLIPAFMSFTLLAVIGVTVYQFAIGVLPANPLMWRMLGYHHTLLIFGIFGLYFLLIRISYNPWLALGASFMVFSIHETLWWVTDFFYLSGISQLPPWYVWFGTFAIASFLTYLSWYTVRAPWPKKFLVAMAAFYVAWYAIGFPVSVNYNYAVGNTPLYGDVLTNGIECLSWLYAFVVFWILESRGLLRWQKEVDKRLNNVHNVT